MDVIRGLMAKAEQFADSLQTITGHRSTSRRKALGLAIACAAFPLAGQLRAVDIYPGTSIQAVVDANPAGTVYLLRTGVHRLQTITPKSGDVYRGESGTVL